MGMPREGFGEKGREIEQHLLQRIRDGRLKPGDRVASDAQLAKRFGVTAITASKALAGLAARGVLTRRRGAAGTIVSPHLGALGTVGFIMGPFTSSYFWRILIGASDALTARGYGVHYINPNLALADGSLWPRVADPPYVGIICVLQIPPVQLPMPTVVVDCDTTSVCPYPTVNCDNEGGGYEMGKHLLEAGHREIVFIKFARQGTTAAKRAEGFVRALREQGVQRAERRVFYCESGSSTIPAIVHEARRQFPRLTAIATASDILAADVLRTLAHEKVRVPGEISVTGFGNLEEMHVTHRITSIDQHPQHLGSQAAAMLLDWVARPDERPPSRVIPCHLVRGDTVAVIRRHN